jgi:hypothetical protein
MQQHIFLAFPQCSKTQGNFLSSSIKSFAPDTSLLFYSLIFSTDKGHQSLFWALCGQQMIARTPRIMSLSL